MQRGLKAVFAPAVFVPSLPSQRMGKEQLQISPRVLIHRDMWLSGEEVIKREGWVSVRAPGGEAYGSWRWHLIQTELK